MHGTRWLRRFGNINESVHITDKIDILSCTSERTKYIRPAFCKRLLLQSRILKRFLFAVSQQPLILGEISHVIDVNDVIIARYLIFVPLLLSNVKCKVSIVCGRNQQGRRIYISDYYTSVIVILLYVINFIALILQDQITDQIRSDQYTNY